MSDVPFQCPSCGARLRATQALVDRGANITCPKCQTLVSLAGLTAPPPVMAAALAPAAPPTPEPESDGDYAPRPKKKKRPRLARRSQGGGSVTVVLLIGFGVAAIAGLIALGIWLVPGLMMSPHEKALSHMLNCLDNVVGTLERIKDRSSAEAELPKLKQNMQALFDSAQALTKLENPSAEVERDLKARYEPRLMAAQQRMMATMNILSKPDVAMVLAPAMIEFAQRGRELQGGRGAGGFGNLGFGQPPPAGPARLR